ncbi:hypothetical protein ACOM2C_02470 [Pseudarthrobacter sp. So.54]
MFALMAEYEAGLIRERTQAGLAAARSGGGKRGRKRKMTPELIGNAHVRRAAIHHGRDRRVLRCHPMTIYRNIRTTKPTPNTLSTNGSTDHTQPPIHQRDCLSGLKPDCHRLRSLVRGGSRPSCDFPRKWAQVRLTKSVGVFSGKYCRISYTVLLKQRSCGR